MNRSRARVVAQMAQDRQVLESSEDTAVWVASTDVSGIALSTNHKEGANSISFDKDGTTEAFGTISKTYDTDHQIDLNDFLQGKLRYWINLSSLTDIASVSLIIGEDASNNYVYTTADTALSTGWNELTYNIKSPDTTNGDGADWGSIGYLAVKVTFDAAGDTLTTILVDMIQCFFDTSSTVNIAGGSGLATETKQDTQITDAERTQDELGAVPAATHTVAGGGEVDDPNALAAATEGQINRFVLDLARRLITTLGTLISGEDTSNDLLKIEQRGASQVILTADDLVVTGSGILRNITFAQGDAAPTAGSIIVYDNTAESGSILYSETFTTGAFRGYTVQLNIPYGTGLYVGFTTTADVNVTLDRRDDV